MGPKKETEKGPKKGPSGLNATELPPRLIYPDDRQARLNRLLGFAVGLIGPEDLPERGKDVDRVISHIEQCLLQLDEVNFDRFEDLLMVPAGLLEKTRFRPN